MAQLRIVFVCTALIAWLSHASTPCPALKANVFGDMHDGDKKEISISGDSLIIKPSGNNQTWVVNAKLDAKTCSAIVDFNVPGKPSPPPVNLTATLWYDDSAKEKKKSVEFTDQSGTLASSTFPLNRWVELGSERNHLKCPTSLEATFADMHDGDKKHVSISGNRMKIIPSGNNQTWVVNARVHAKTCSAVVDFNVPGKPSPPPVNLKISYFRTWNPNNLVGKADFEFTDPSGTLADASVPLNHWVEIVDGHAPSIL